jgi:hypothetical protein
LTIYHSGLRFVRPSERETNIVRRIISSRVARALRERHANAYGLNVDEVDHATSDVAESPDPSRVYLNELMSVNAAKRRDYIRCTLEGAQWKRQVVDSGEQPSNGFTVSADEGEESIRMLCKAFETSSAEGRQMIRAFAHVSLTDPSGVPRDLFQP